MEWKKSGSGMVGEERASPTLGLAPLSCEFTNQLERGRVGALGSPPMPSQPTNSPSLGEELANLA